MSNCENYVSEEDIRALKESEQHIEHVARSRNSVGDKALSVTDTIRGESVTNRTLDGLEKLYTDKIESLGYQQMGDYEVGLTVSSRDQIVFYDGSWYVYRGELPHVTTGATLPDDGGIYSDANPDGLWVGIGGINTHQIDNVNNFKFNNFHNYTIVSTRYHTVSDYGSAQYIIKPLSEYNGEPDDKYADFYTNGGQSVAMLFSISGTYDITQLGCIPDGNYKEGTGTDNTDALSFTSIFCEKRGGASFIAHGSFKGKHKINRDNYHIKGTAEIWYDGLTTRDYTFEIEAYYGANNFGPFLGKPWLKPEGMAPNVFIKRITQNVVKGSNEVRVESTNGVVAGMTGIIISGSQINSTENNHIPLKFQYVKVADTYDSTIIIDDDVLYENMDVSGDDTYFVYWRMVENVRVEGLTYLNKQGADYLHRIGGCWDAYVDVTMKPQTACGAAACNRRLHYQVKCDTGYNGVSTARMSQEITIAGSINPVRRDGGSENLGLFIEENPRHINLDDLVVRNAEARISMLESHSYITGNIDVVNNSGVAVTFGASDGAANVDLRGRIESGSSNPAVASEYIGTDAVIRFNGLIYNTGGGVAWSHNASNSASSPIFTGVTNAELESVNYVDVVKVGTYGNAPLSKLAATVLGTATVTVSDNAVTDYTTKGSIYNITYIETGKFRVQLKQSIGTNYSVSALTDLNGVSIQSKNTDYFELWCFNNGTITDPSTISVQLFI